MTRIFIGALAVGGLLWGVYYLMNNADTPLVGMNPTKLREFHYTSSGLWDQIKKAGSSAGNLAARESKIAKDKLAKSFSKIALEGSDLAGKGKTTALEQVKNWTDSAFNSTVDAVRNYLNIATSTPNPQNGSPSDASKNNLQESAASPLFFKTVIKRNQEITLSVNDVLFQKNNNRNVDYSVNWGDGNRESGTFYYSGGNRLISHTFSSAGEYNALFTFTLNQNRTDYAVPITVIE